MERAFKVAALAVVAYKLGGVVQDLMDENHSFVKTGRFTKRSDRAKYYDKDENGELQVLEKGIDSYFFNEDGLYIFYRKWTPITGFHPAPKAIVVMVHGLAEHSGRYEQVARQLVKLGCVVYALDHQGHGGSEGDRKYVKWFFHYPRDVLHVTEIAKEAYPSVKQVFLLGHSLGALISIHSVLRAPRLYDGLLLSAPPLKIDKDTVPDWQRPLLHALSGALPKFPMPGLDLSTLCRDERVVDLYFNDPLVCITPHMSARMVDQTLLAMEQAAQRASEITLPYLLMHGKKDRMCLFEGSEAFHKATNSVDKTFIEYPESFHELLNEPNHEKEALLQVVEWLRKHIK